MVGNLEYIRLEADRAPAEGGFHVFPDVARQEKAVAAVRELQDK